MKKLIALVLAALVGVCYTAPCFVSAADSEGSAGSESTESRVETILKGMTTEQKIAQTLMVDFRQWGGENMYSLDSDVADYLADHQFGAFILFKENIDTTEGTLQLTQDIQAAATRDGGIPMLIATDQEGGIVYRLGCGTAMPGNMALTATGDSSNAEKAGKVIGSELSAVGINTDLAPVLDVNNNANNPVIGLRSFSDDADTVGDYGSAMLSGLQSQGVATCAKHFPGHGDTGTDSHYGLPVVDKSLDQLEQTELKSFQIAIDNDVDMIMTAHILYPQLDSTTIYSDKTQQEESRPATLSKKIITDLLKGDMGFEGVVSTDGMNMQGITDTFDESQAVVEALAAGVDLICMPASGISSKEELVRLDNILSAVGQALESGYITEERLDDAVTRILTLKENRGVLDYDATQYSVEKATETVGSDFNREAERQISAKAVTVVKNKGQLLPLKVGISSRVLMISPGEDESAQMLMAWNRAKKESIIPESAKVKYCTYSEDAYTIEGELKEKLDWADTVIVNSKVSSASAMSYSSWQAGAVNSITSYCNSNGKKSLVISVSKPYDVQLYPNADAVMAVYGYKGSELDPEEVLKKGITASEDACGPNITAGVEVALGIYGASGKLPVDIPKYNAVSCSYTDDVVYKRGYGISYQARTAMAFPETFTLSNTKYIYNGKFKNPRVTVKDSAGKIVSETNYRVAKSLGRNKVGTHTYTLTFTGKFKGTKKLSFKILPAGSSIKSLTSGERKLTVKTTTKPSVKGGGYYQIAYKQKGAGKWQYTRTTGSCKTIKGLKKGKTYYVKVRACKKVRGKVYYGAWSKTKLSSKIKS